MADRKRYNWTNELTDKGIGQSMERMIHEVSAAWNGTTTQIIPRSAWNRAAIL